MAHHVLIQKEIKYIIQQKGNASYYLPVCLLAFFNTLDLKT